MDSGCVMMRDVLCGQPFSQKPWRSAMDSCSNALPFSVNQVDSSEHLPFPRSTGIDPWVLRTVLMSKCVTQWRVKILLQLTCACCSHTIPPYGCLCHIPGTLKFTFQFQTTQMCHRFQTSDWFLSLLCYININTLADYLIIGLEGGVGGVRTFIEFGLSLQEKERPIIRESGNKMVTKNWKEDLISGPFETYPRESIEKKIKWDYE